MNKLWYRLLGIGISALVIYMLFNHYGLWSYLSLDGFNHYHQQILEFEQKHVISFTLIYILSYIVLIACCIPGTILFDLLAGFIYGTVLGTPIVLVSYLSGAILNFILVRTLFKDVLHQKFSHLRHIVLRDGGRTRTAYNLIGLRFIPIIPFWLLNILAAILDIPLVTFIITTFIGIIPTSVIYVMIGNGVRSQLAENAKVSLDVLTNPELWIPLVLLALLIIIPNLYKSFKKNS
ncbi:TVP38/TMEM64 family protein [Aquella oligotrophica]|uniref:VTT domain-containing protein n=1 Tax=Aquella oligotrophica TaxID=2067065 RepID=A0A2I7N564_9NEIS|nr:VTT domain-containing protein [Aquella oligotrophica]AUR51588.1 hypothetical protein CUN60_04550 [Aquella oligotrophica]